MKTMHSKYLLQSQRMLVWLPIVCLLIFIMVYYGQLSKVSFENPIYVAPVSEQRDVLDITGTG